MHDYTELLPISIEGDSERQYKKYGRKSNQKRETTENNYYLDLIFFVLYAVSINFKYLLSSLSTFQKKEKLNK